MKVSPSVKLRKTTGKKCDIFVRRKGVLRVINKYIKRNKQRQG